MKTPSAGTSSLRNHLKNYHKGKYELFLKNEEMKKMEFEKKSADRLRKLHGSLKRSFAGHTSSAVMDKQPKFGQPRIDNALIGRRMAMNIL
jgi:hypothetical protein